MRRRLLVWLVLLAGCGGIERSVRLKVPVSASRTVGCTVDDTHTFDLTEDESFAKYGDYIDDARFVSARVEVKSVGEDNQARTATGTVSFRDAAGEAHELFTYELPLSVGAGVDVVPDESAAEALMKQLLAAPHQAELHTEGSADGEPCRFSFVIDAEVVFVVGPTAIFADAGRYSRASVSLVTFGSSKWTK